MRFRRAFSIEHFTTLLTVYLKCMNWTVGVEVENYELKQNICICDGYYITTTSEHVAYQILKLFERKFGDLCICSLSFDTFTHENLLEELEKIKRKRFQLKKKVAE